MKKRILSISLVLVMLVTAICAIPAQAATYEEWEFGAYSNGIVRLTYHINMANLKTDYFTIYNNSQYPVALIVRYNGEVVWEVIGDPYTTQSFDYILNFQRLPKTDPDDPDSVRYPNGYSLGSRYPAY